MKQRIRIIAEHYGYETQREQLVEECAELIQAVSKCKRSIPGSYDNFKEELADVLIMAQQLRYIIGEESINDIIDKKLNRQIERIKANEES